MSRVESSEAYYQRRGELHRLLKSLGPKRTCRELAAWMGASSHKSSSNEIRAKLMSLRNDGLVSYEDGRWTAK